MTELTFDQTVTLKLKVNKPSNLPPFWEIENDGVAELVVSEDKMFAEVLPLKTGTTSVHVRTNCDLGSGYCQQDVYHTIHVVSELPPVEIVAGEPS